MEQKLLALENKLLVIEEYNMVRPKKDNFSEVVLKSSKVVSKFWLFIEELEQGGNVEENFSKIEEAILQFNLAVEQLSKEFERELKCIKC